MRLKMIFSVAAGLSTALLVSALRHLEDTAGKCELNG